jgi:hypothetical protein
MDKVAVVEGLQAQVGELKIAVSINRAAQELKVIVL